MGAAQGEHMPCALQLIRLTLTTISVAFLRNTWPVTSKSTVFTYVETYDSQRANAKRDRKKKHENILVVVRLPYKCGYLRYCVFFSYMVPMI